MSPRFIRSLLLATSAMCVAASPARAQPDSGSVTENLIELLVQKGVLPRDQAAALLRQAQAEARSGKAAPASAKTARGAKTAPVAAEPAGKPGDVRVTYVPQTVRDQIADQVRAQVMSEAKSEGWAQPNVLPDWVQRVRVYGDVRVRGEQDLFQKNNTSGGTINGGNYPFFPDFNAINNSGGFNINQLTQNAPNAPLLNTTQNRERNRVRARIGVIAQLDDGFSSEIRVATGNDNSPVSFNQTFGANGGNFSKASIYLDRAYIKWAPNSELAIVAGRAPNPFFTSDLLYYGDLSFDGISVSGSYPINDHVRPFAVAGAFPVFNTDFNFSSDNYPSKAASRDKYLLAIQGGTDWKINDDYAAKLGVGYFTYSNIQGKPSAPCLLLVSSDVCSTDLSRANFVQQGNTQFGIRNFVTDPNNPTAAQPQLYGLASKFGILDVHGRFDIDKFRPVQIALEGDFVKNLAFNRADILKHGPANNFAPGTVVNGQVTQGPYAGGDTGYLMRVTVGTPEITKRWDWNVSLAYKYLESDAVLDAVTDPDFHLGGTNAKGYIFGGNLGIARNTFLSARWLSSNQVSGPPYQVDVLQLELNARF